MLTGPNYSPIAYLPGRKKGNRIDNTRRCKGTKVMVQPNGTQLSLVTNHVEVNLIDSAVTPHVPN